MRNVASTSCSVWIRVLCALLFLYVVPSRGRASELVLARNGKTAYVIITQPGRTEAEQHAADELAHFLARMTGATFCVHQDNGVLSEKAILIGPGPAASRCFPDVNLATLGPEEFIIRFRDQRLLLAGGRPRGTLYAVYRFLDALGCRWWSPWADTIPHRPSLAVARQDRHERPAFTWREPLWFPTLNGDWAVRNQVNGACINTTEKTGGHLRYAGFVHTFYTLVPPERYFSTHPQWFSLVNGRRTHQGGQLCLTNPELRQFVAGQVKDVIRANPQADIVSVSQNDGAGQCECERCRRLDTLQGSASGSLLDFVNAVAEEVHKDYPHVLIDTLAYQHTRKPPRDLRASPNVAVRVCSIECDFSVPLDHPRNASYAADLLEWSKRCRQLFVWDYGTNFAHFLLPHPNWFVLGSNARFFQRSGVVSVFVEGNSFPSGGELAELRSWLLARLLWDPQLNDQALIDEFLSGYYGPVAGTFIRQYLDLMQRAGSSFLSFSNPVERSPFLSFSVLREADALWRQAWEAARGDPARAWRVQQGALSVRYAWLVRWVALRRECSALGTAWPLPESRQAVAEEWLRVATGPGPDGWKPLDRLEEFPGELSPAQFVARLSIEPVYGKHVERSPLPSRLTFLTAAFFGPPRGILWLGLIPLVIGVVLSLKYRSDSWMRTRRILLFSSLFSLMVGSGLCLWMQQTSPARAVSFGVLGAIGAMVLAVPLVYLCLVHVGRRRALAMSALACILPALALWSNRLYLQARLRPQAGTDYQAAWFAGADLSQANLDRAALPRANLTCASLQKACLNFSDLHEACLYEADLRGALLQYPNLQGADLRGADLRDIQLIDISFTALTGAVYDARTRWPNGFDPANWDMILAQ